MFPPAQIVKPGPHDVLEPLLDPQGITPLSNRTSNGQGMQRLLVKTKSGFFVNEMCCPKKLSTLVSNRQRRGAALNAVLDITRPLNRQRSILMTCQCPRTLEKIFKHGHTSVPNILEV
jgi:hypothetical protein